MGKTRKANKVTEGQITFKDVEKLNEIRDIGFCELTSEDYNFDGWKEYTELSPEEQEIDGMFSGLTEKKKKQSIEIKVDSAEKIENTKIDGPKVMVPAEVISNNVFINGSNKNRDAALNELTELQKKDRDFPYKAVNILTEAEKKLYIFMKNNLTDSAVIFTKVRLADIVSVDDRLTKEQYYFSRICAKHIDFVICDSRTLDVICAVELDDFTHDTKDRIHRDMFVAGVLMSAGIPLVRIRTRVFALTKDDLTDIEFNINKYQAPICPHCKIKTEPKVSKKNHRFWGCPNFFSEIKCSFTKDID